MAKNQEGVARTGAATEQELFGTVNLSYGREHRFFEANTERLDALFRFLDRTKRPRDFIKSLGDALQIVKKHQPWDVDEKDPNYPEFAGDLHALIAKRLGLDDWSELKYFTCVAPDIYDQNSSRVNVVTHADLFHGIDCFFELHDRETRCIFTVTIDGTTRPNKDKQKAMVLMTNLPSGGFGDDQKELREKILKKYSTEIAEAFKKDIEKIKNRRRQTKAHYNYQK